VFVRDYREAAKQGDTFADFRALTLFRWKVTGPVAVVLALLVALAHGCLPAAPARCGHRAAVLGRPQPGRRTDGAARSRPRDRLSRTAPDHSESEPNSRRTVTPMATARAEMLQTTPM
jgi:hypothetical protein